LERNSPLLLKKENTHITKFKNNFEEMIRANGNEKKIDFLQAIKLHFWRRSALIFICLSGTGH
jgi:hypothetical protein